MTDHLIEIEQLVASGQLSDALKCCRERLTQHPLHLPTHRLLADIQQQQGALAEAQDTLQRVLSADPNDAAAHRALAELFSQQDQPQRARWHAARAQALRPYAHPSSASLSREALAHLYARGDLYDLAERELRALLLQQPDRVDLRVVLAEVLWRAGMRGQAIEQAQAILAVLPYCRDAHAILAQAWTVAGQPDMAATHWHILREMVDPEQVGLETAVGQAFAMRGTLVVPDGVVLRYNDGSIGMEEHQMDDQDKKENESQDVPESPERELPEDLEAAMAWLEQLAARQGAPKDELPSINDEDDLTGDPDRLPDWLKELPDSPETEEALDLDGLDLPIDDTVPEEDLPDWLKVRAAAEASPDIDSPADGPADAAESLDWLDELTAGSETEELPTMQWEGEPGATADTPPSTLNEPDPLEDEPGEVAEVTAAAAAAAAAAVPDANQDEVEDAMAWLEQLAAGEADAIDEMPTLVSERRESEPPDDEPEAIPVPEPSAAEPVPEDIDDPMDWLEQLAADQDTPLEELPSVADRALASTVMSEVAMQAVGPDKVVLPERLETAVAFLEQRAAEQGISLADVELAEIEPVDSIDDLLTSVDAVAQAQPGEAGRSGAILAAGAAAVGVAAMQEDEDLDWDELSSEMPEDPDEALAWLERLAEDAELSEQELMTPDEVVEVVEEPPTKPGVQPIPPPPDTELVVPEAEVDEDFLSEMPEDPDEAMAWLEQLAARQGASLDELPTVDQVPDEVETPEWLAAQAEEAVDDAADDTSGGFERSKAAIAGLGAAAAAAMSGDDEPDEAPEQVDVDETAVVDDEDSLDAAKAVGMGAAAAAIGAAVMGDGDDEPEPTDAEAPPAERTDAELAALLEREVPAELIEEEPSEEALAWLDEHLDGDVDELLADEEEAAASSVYDPRVAPLPTSEMSTRPEMTLDSEHDSPQLEEVDLAGHGRAQSLLGAGDIDSAAEAYQLLIDEGDGLPQVIADLETAVVDHADKPVLNRLLGDAYMRNGQLQKALEAYRQALDHL